MGRPFLSPRILFQLFVILIFGTISIAAQESTPPPRASSPAASQQGIYLVFPFENVSASPRLDWLSAGLEELTIQRLSAAREQVYSHEGRLVELERSGLPRSSKLSRATMLHLAEDLDADFVVFGKFAADGASLTIESQILKVSPARMQSPLRETGTLDSLMDLHARLVWRMLSANDRKYRLSMAEFTKLQRPLRLDAFEHYIRGLLATEDDARLRELREAARLEPEWPEPDFALAEVYFARRDCDAALPWYARVPKSHDRYAEAVFANGVCQLLLGHPDHAEELFISLQDTLKKNGVFGADLPEILNNLAIARTRQGKTAPAQIDFRRAADSDPGEDDYAFNLGLLSLQTNDPATAAGYFREAAEREPDNAEDRALLILSLEKAGKKAEADQERVSATESFGPNGLPAIHLDAKNETLARMHRITTELDVTALRPEIVSADSPASEASSSDSAGDSSVSRLRRARQDLSAGRVDAAEKEYRAVLAADQGSAAAHYGLAEIDRRQGKMDDAVKELQASVQARDSAVVRTMLAKIYLEQKKLDLARTEVEKALKIAPNYIEAKQLLEHLQNSKPGEKKPGGGAP
ncbi:MAG TPA: tetratricopeptide repeat protein [Candidatus Acidoferrum sp.]|nr:tetratricopeptide repeat protein [Candidatus Acidoferrum sp.]